ncbi:hypothetical protein MHU86_14511 [Fragilaria crotonensis]|nr:hypothetical protein MHU86_14511 [Fragilaria crotonensis]
MFRRRVWKKWLPAETWAEALRASGLIDADVHLIDVKSFNAAMIRSKLDFNGHLMERFDGTNNSGIFSDLSEEVVLLGYGSKYTIRAPSILSLLSFHDNNTSDVTHPETTSNKRQRTGSIQEVVDSLGTDAIVVDESVHFQADRFSYWDSREAYNLFGGQNARAFGEVEGHNTKDTLEHHIKILKSVSEDQNGWRNVVEGRDPDNLCTALDIFMLRGRAIILCFAYQTAIAQMNKWTWQQCCTKACEQLNQLGLVQATHRRTVQDWNVEFRKRGTFLHPNHIVRCGKRPLPLLFLRFPKAEEKITAFGLSNLTTLTVELVHSFCLEKLIPELFKQWCDDMEQCRIEEGTTDRLNHEPLSQEMFLLEHGIRNFSIPTCWRWLHRLGFSYNTQKKGYYVDGHERSDVIACREQFCSDYLTKLEPRCLRWVQFTASELATTRNSILNPAFGHSYIDSEGEMCYEFHVDYCYSFDTANDGNGIMDGKVPSMSIRAPKPSRPIEIYGQDESVFSQYLFPPKSWVGPNQQRGLMPKSLGEGLMISAFVSRDTGFGMPISDENLAAINEIRHGKEYIDKTAALEVYKCTRKPPLTQSPFVRHLLIGATKGGYWNSFHMAIQLEDAVDCLQYLRPQFDFVFLFDHSQGHARKKDGALDANSMSRSFGGVQPKMRCSTIEAGCLGPFPSILNIGDEQSMAFKDGDRGPWWFVSNELCDKRKHDTPDTGGRSKLYNELESNLLKPSLRRPV